MTQKEQIKEILTNLDDTTLFYLYNDYIHKNNYYNDEIFFNHEIEEILTPETEQ